MKIIQITFLSAFFLCSAAFAEDKKGDVVIINSNEANAQTVTATALVPSKATDIRKAREEAEVSTESHILEKLEAARLKDEQKRIDNLLGAGGDADPSIQPQPTLPAAASPQWVFGEKAFVSIGGGLVNYFDGINVESLDQPAVFVSLGGYGMKNFLFDFTGYWSKHSMKETKKLTYTEVSQISLALSVKLSPLQGRLKPYAGVVGAYNLRRYIAVNEYGDPVSSSHVSFGAGKWYNAVDVGPALGVDIALAPRLGVNAGIVCLFNVHTEERDSPDLFSEVLSKKPSIVFSGNFRFYF